MGKFGWSYPPGCSGPPEEPGMHPKSEEVWEILEKAEVSEEVITQVTAIVDELAILSEKECTFCLDRLAAEELKAMEEWPDESKQTHTSQAELWMERKDQMLSEPTKPCKWRVGDVVKFTNEFGVEFAPHKVIGFAKPEDELHGRFIYIDTDCPWMPVTPSSLSRLGTDVVEDVRLGIIVRADGDGQVDEVVAGKKKGLSIHLEKLDDDVAWIEVSAGGKGSLVLRVGIHDGALSIMHDWDVEAGT